MSTARPSTQLFAGFPPAGLALLARLPSLDPAGFAAEILAAGAREVVVFHSPADELLTYQADPPFAVIADPDRRLYREFGVEASLRALLDPRAWPAAIRGALRSRRPLPGKEDGGMLGLPADFLISPAAACSPASTARTPTISGR